jgi:hypothetical protein
MSIVCPNCHNVCDIGETFNPKIRRYKCPKCKDEFYGYNTLQSMDSEELRKAYRFLKKKPYFNECYSYLKAPAWKAIRKKHKSW